MTIGKLLLNTQIIQKMSQIINLKNQLKEDILDYLLLMRANQVLHIHQLVYSKHVFMELIKKLLLVVIN